MSNSVVTYLLDPINAVMLLVVTNCPASPALVEVRFDLVTLVPYLVQAVLSLASLGLGYAWSLIDEDQLCWHDRVTATHIAPKPRL